MSANGTWDLTRRLKG